MEQVFFAFSLHNHHTTTSPSGALHVWDEVASAVEIVVACRPPVRNPRSRRGTTVARRRCRQTGVTPVSCQEPSPKRASRHGGDHDETTQCSRVACCSPRCHVRTLYGPLVGHVIPLIPLTLSRTLARGDWGRKSKKALHMVATLDSSVAACAAQCVLSTLLHLLHCTTQLKLLWSVSMELHN